MITLSNVKEIVSDASYCPIGYIFGSKKYFKVLQSLDMQLSTGRVVVIPKNFKTDLSSVPRLFWASFPTYGDFLLAAILHDFLYIYNIGTRKEADREMLVWSVVLNDNQLDNFIRYVFVRWFGKSWWEHKVKFIQQLATINSQLK